MLNQIKRFHVLSRSGLLFVMLTLGVFLSLGINTPAFADKPIVDGTITAGSLSGTAMEPYTATGTAGATTTFTLPLSISDMTGGATGWNLTMTSTPLTSGSNTIPTTASTIIGTTGVCAAGGPTGVNCMQASLTNTVPGSVALPAGDGPPAGVKFFEIAAAPASGVYTITPTISVVIPDTTPPGTYASNITIVASGVESENPVEIQATLLLTIGKFNYTNMLVSRSNLLSDQSQSQNGQQILTLFVHSKQVATNVTKHLKFREKVDMKAFRNFLRKFSHTNIASYLNNGFKHQMNILHL